MVGGYERPAGLGPALARPPNGHLCASMPRAVPLAAVLALALALAPAGCGGGGGEGRADAGRQAARARDGAGALGSAPTPACFGAAARDPAAPHCVNRRLARTVV